ncbi:nuclear transport factor 2 family protein [Flavobacterium sp.]|uniref:nuclear transport factor 2 family protein n=1 Tax=Flavobacterium sp. TaxID=239 RepID=UPI001228F6AE|nr:nuclear transport factor 2 family protein [Flavobacterium sp.]RZJ72548.1 MAG: nuclear transport factor 2 family protein [Flavobacterium sp.]
METLIKELIEAANAFDTDGFLEKFHLDAVLDDPSVGQKFVGHQGIRTYFTNYFIGYNTQTNIVKFKKTGENTAHLEVWFTGNFPGGEVGGEFDFEFGDSKIISLKADLT